MKKKKTQKQKDVSITKAMLRFFLLSTAYLMEEYDWSDDDVENYYLKMNEWTNAIQSKLINMETVAKIIEDKTGMELHWR